MFATNDIIAAVIGIVAILIVLSLIKGIVKFIITVVVIILAGLYIFMPSKLTSVTDLAKSEAFSKVQEVVNNSDTVKMGKDSNNDTTISIKIGDKWFNTNEIKDVVSISDDKCVLNINGERYEVTDKQIIKVIKLMK
jgi:GTP:adenosylcobinamide-phosphate guanylyltransferase